MVRAYSLGAGGRHLARLEPLKARTREERARLGERLNGDAWHAQANLRVLLERCLHDGGKLARAPADEHGIAEVEVDKATGKVTVVDYAAAVDCGTVINEALARVQAEGGIAQGIGHALYEIVEHDDLGRLRTGNFMSYMLPTRLDIGSIRVAFEPSYEPTGPFGAKSIGEVVINTPLAAVASAVAHATGHQVRSLPITPEKALLGE